MKKKIPPVILIVILFLGAGAVWAIAKNEKYPRFQDGDLIFHTSKSNQSSAILIATADPFTHMGIIKKTPKGYNVIEAGATVKETSLNQWISRGIRKRFAVYRYDGLTTQQATKILGNAKSFYGKRYDPFFSFKNNAIYCSELPYLAYKKAGIKIGKIQKLSELNFDNALVKELIKKRWKKHKECTDKRYTFEQCYKHILEQKLITPASIANDSQLTKIHSNYPLF